MAYNAVMRHALNFLPNSTNADLKLMGLGFGAAAFALVIIFILLAFEIWMFVDVIQNKKLSHEERAIWIVGMLLIHPFVAIFYYFLRSQNKLK